MIVTVVVVMRLMVYFIHEIEFADIVDNFWSSLDESLL